MNNRDFYKLYFLFTVTVPFMGLNFASAQTPTFISMKPTQECPPTVHLNTQGLPDMDCGTLDILIRHDRYTIGLLHQLLRQTTRPELKALIQQMLNDHEQEMTKLNNLRKDWYGQPLNQAR